MTEMWDIARYVEEHPDDHEQRWRLAKKLYTAWEYRLALEHLQVLKNEWPKKVNVIRYLAATYYRLGRYDESITELREAIQTWPSEIGLREQLARVLEIAGRRLEAADLWEEINKKDPHHPLAQSAARRLRENEIESPEKDLHLGDSDSGIDLSPGRICRHCGAQNSEEFDRCWQCHASLSEDIVTSARNNAPAKASRLSGMPVLTPETVSLAAGLMVVGLISLAIYLSLTLLLGSADQNNAPPMLRTLWDVYTQEMQWSRVLTGTALLILWPMSLWLSLYLIKPTRPVPAALVNLTGVMLGAFSFVSTWMPPQMLLWMPVCPAVIAMGVILISFGLGFLRALNLWALHLVFVSVFTLTLFTVIESVQLKEFFNPFREIPALVHYARQQQHSDKPGQYTLPGSEVPIIQQVVWETTGSAWLNKRAGETEFTVFANSANSGLRFEINQGETQPRVYETVTKEEWSIRYPIAAGETYTVRIHGTPGTQARVVISGLLIPDFR